MDSMAEVQHRGTLRRLSRAEIWAAVSLAMMTPPECVRLVCEDALAAEYELANGRFAKFVARVAHGATGLRVGFLVRRQSDEDLDEIRMIHEVIVDAIPPSPGGRGRRERLLSQLLRRDPGDLRFGSPG